MLGPRVTQYLLERGRLDRHGLEEAQRTQGFFGGEIESHLLKLGLVTEAQLAEALTEVSGVPYASWEHLRAIPGEVLESIPTALIERHKVCPFRIEERRLRVAMLDPRNRAALTDLQAVTPLQIEPWITIEPRLYHALSRFYRLRMPAWTQAIAIAPPSIPRGPSSPAPTPTATDPTADVGLDGKPLDADVSVEDHFYYTLGGLDPAAFDEVARPPEATPAPAPPKPPSPETPAPPDDPLARLGEAVARAEDRDAIAEALLDFCATRSARSGLFAASKGGFRGVLGRGRGFDREAVARVSIPEGSGTIFDTALQSRDFYFGVVPALPPNRDLYTALGGRLPTTVLIVPIRVKDRVAALLYLDGDDAPLPTPDIGQFRRIAAKAGLAFEILLLKSKIRAL